MLCRPLLCVLMLVLGLMLPSEAQSGELLRILKSKCPLCFGHNRSNLQASQVSPPAHWYPQNVPDIPRGPVSTFSWGSFGAQSRTQASTHVGYYSDYFQTAYRRGY